MTDAALLAETMNTYGVTSQQFYMACVLLAEVGLESALKFVRELHPTPAMPEWKETGDSGRQRWLFDISPKKAII